MYQSYPRLLQRLRCVSCLFSTSTGDMMANHLAERPEHRGCSAPHSDLGVGVAGKQLVKAAGPSTHKPHSVVSAPSLPGRRSSGGRAGGFIPIHLLPSGTPSTQLSVRPLTSPSPLCSSPAMTIKFLGPRPPPEEYVEEAVTAARSPPGQLSVFQLSAVLFSLCNGLPQAAARFETPPALIQSWTLQEERRRSGREWSWSTDRIAEWVLSQREQQLSLSEQSLLQTAAEALGEDSELLECYRWAVHLMLRHELGLQPRPRGAAGRRRLPRNVYESSRIFTRFLYRQIQSKELQPRSIGAMDELSVFVDPDEFAAQNPSAFRLFGTSESPLFDVVLSGLADGTFFPPVLFFRGRPPLVPEGFPDNVWLEARPEGFTDQQRLDIWLNKVWRPRVAAQSGGRSLLIVDTHRGHLQDSFLTGLNSLSVPAVIPISCCCRLQPLDVCITPVLREFLQACWTQLLSRGGAEGLGLDQLALTLACWLSEVASTLSAAPHLLRRSFSVVSTPPHEEDGEEPGRLIQNLTEALIRPLDANSQPDEPVQLLLVMEEEQGGEEEQQEDEQQEEQQEEEQQEDEQQEDEQQEVSLQSSSSLRRLFEGDSDLESFHGFEEREMDK
ncbi:pogo transposable element with ZNF domain [Centroberyx gerrardi]